MKPRHALVSAAPATAFAALLAATVVAVFLSHWSLLDGAPRNSLELMLQGHAHRPFAYRWLMPLIVRITETLLPAPLHALLADQLAPFFQAHFVQPLTAAYEARLPGVTARAAQAWQASGYRASYVLMVALVWLSFTGALLFMAGIARAMGCSRAQTLGVMLAYALVYPGSFLHAAYFYDFGEQLLAIAMIFFALRRHWPGFALALVLMQCNRETAVLMPLLLAPLLWQARASLRLPRNLLPMAAAWYTAIAVLLATRMHFAQLPGGSAEFSLAANLAFWRESANWLATSDIYVPGLPVPRLGFAAFVALALAFAWRRGASAMAVSATACTALMLLLLLGLGFRDEFRAVGLCLPFVLAAACASMGAASKPKNTADRRRQAATVRPDLSQYDLRKSGSGKTFALWACSLFIPVCVSPTQPSIVQSPTEPL